MYQGKGRLGSANIPQTKITSWVVFDPTEPQTLTPLTQDYWESKKFSKI